MRVRIDLLRAIRCGVERTLFATEMTDPENNKASMPLPRRIAYFVLDHRRAVTIVLVCITAILSFQLRLFRISQDITENLPDNDPDVLYFERFRRDFADAELMVIGIESEEVFSHEVLLYIRRLTDLVENVEGVTRVVSLTNVAGIRSDGDEFVSAPFLDEIPTSPAVLSRKRSEALSQRDWVRNILSVDGKAASINVLMQSFADGSVSQFRVLAEVKEILERNRRAGVNVYLAGMTPILGDSLDLVWSDLKRFAWLTPVLMLLVLFVVFRTARGVVIPLGIIFLSVVWTLGLFFTAGKTVNMITTMLPTLIAVICLSDVIHVIAHYYELSAAQTDKREILTATMEHMIPACFLTSLTTAVGFASLTVSQMKSVREFGVFSAIGILIAYVLGMTVVPVALSYLPLPKSDLQSRYQRSLTARILDRLVAFLIRDRIRIPLVTLGVFLACAWGIARMHVETYIASYLPKSAPSIQGMSFLQKKLAGFSNLEIALEGNPEVFQEPWAIREVEKIQRFLESRPDVDKTFSIADFLKRLHRTRGGGDDDMYVVPDDAGLIAEYLLLFSMTDQSDVLESFASADYAKTRIAVRIHSMGTAGHLELLSALEEFARGKLDPRLTLRTTGLVKIFATNVTAVVDSLLRSLGVSIVVIALLMVIHLRSFAVGLLSMVPNIAPVVMTFGMMGIAGISLNASTVMIFCVAIAIAVDDTIHFLTRYRREIAKSSQILPSITQTMLHCGRAMIFTSLVIAVGFAILCYSNFAPNRHFGLLTAFTMGAALIADLLILPYLIKTFRLK